VVQPRQVSPYNGYILLTFFLGALPASLSLQNHSFQSSAHIEDSNMSPVEPQKRPQASLETLLASLINQSLGGSSSIPTPPQKDNEVESYGNNHEMENRTDDEMGHRRDKEAKRSEEMEADGRSDEEAGVSGNEAGLSEKDVEHLAAEMDDRQDEEAERLDEEIERSDAEPKRSDEEPERSDEEAEQSDEEIKQSDEEAELSGEMDVEPMSQKAPPLKKRKQPSQQRPRKRRRVSKKVEEEEDDLLEDESPEDTPISHLKAGTHVNPIDVDLFVSKWEPMTPTEVVSVFHMSFSVSSFFL
jgi:hypothetical protein